METPVILHEGSYGINDLVQLKRSHKIWRSIDLYNAQLAELAEIRFPASVSQQETFIIQQATGDTAGSWVYFPWSGVLLHCLDEEQLNELRTNRNRNLISADEQKSLQDAIVAIAGMSVGAGIAVGSVYAGMSKTIKLADYDVLETANLNRLRESLANIGTAKALLAARHIYEVNPFASIQMFDTGISEDNIDAFFENPTTTIVIDEIDDFKMKVRLRQKAKEHKTPLLMFTSLGDNILIDVERYDTDIDLEIFNGAIGDVATDIMEIETLSMEDIRRYAVRLVGAKYVPTKALGSLSEIGTTLVGRPQLYGTIAVDGGLATYLIRSIILGEPVKSGRYFVKFSELIGLNAADLADSKQRQQILGRLQKNG